MAFSVTHQEVAPRMIAGAVPPIVREVLHSTGTPLDTGIRRTMQARFGHDFSRVRIHTDTRAAESARAVDALAYAAGRDIVLDPDRCSRDTSAGGIY